MSYTLDHLAERFDDLVTAAERIAAAVERLADVLDDASGDGRVFVRIDGTVRDGS
jgi:hypothetical protein